MNSLSRKLKSYPTEFPFRDPSSLLRCTTVILKDLSKMHIDDTHDNNLVAEQIALHTHTRAQNQTSTADTSKVLDLTTSSDDQTENNRSNIY